MRPGVHAVVTGRDLPDRRVDTLLLGMPITAEKVLAALKERGESLVD